MAKRFVNGEPVDIPAEEEAAFRAEQAAMTAAHNATADRERVLAELQAIDAASIRAIRETLAARPESTPELRAREAEAQAARAKLTAR